jgi:hypothetical protein
MLPVDYELHSEQCLFDINLMVKINIFKVYLSLKRLSEDSMGEKISKKIKFEYYHTTNIILKY